MQTSISPLGDKALHASLVRFQMHPLERHINLAGMAGEGKSSAPSHPFMGLTFTRPVKYSVLDALSHKMIEVCDMS